DYKLSANNSGPDQEEKSMPLSGGDSFQEILLQQISLRIINEQQKQIVSYIIGNLDDSGYLRRELESIVDDLAFNLNITVTLEELEKLLKIVQQLDPPGVGARTLQECLLIQLNRKEVDSIA